PVGMNDCEQYADCADPIWGIGQPGQDLWGGINFGPGNPANGFEFGDLTNGAGQADDQQIARDIAALNAFGFTGSSRSFKHTPTMGGLSSKPILDTLSSVERWSCSVAVQATVLGGVPLGAAYSLRQVAACLTSETVAVPSRIGL